MPVVSRLLVPTVVLALAASGCQGSAELTVTGAPPEGSEVAPTPPAQLAAGGAGRVTTLRAHPTPVPADPQPAPEPEVGAEPAPELRAEPGLARPMSIGDIDFYNHSYELDLVDLSHRSITVEDGHASLASPSSVDHITFMVHDVDFGDLDSDWTDEAVVTAKYSRGGSGYFSLVYVYDIVDDEPRLVTTEHFGDRANGGILDVRIEGPIVMVEIFGTDLGACCPTMVERADFVLHDERLEWSFSMPPRRFVTVGDGSPQPIEFLPGTHSALVAIPDVLAEAVLTFEAVGGQLAGASVVTGGLIGSAVATNLETGELRDLGSGRDVARSLPSSGLYEAHIVIEHDVRDGSPALVELLVLPEPPPPPPLPGAPEFPVTWTAVEDHEVHRTAPIVESYLRRPEFSAAGADLSDANARIADRLRAGLDAWLASLEEDGPLDDSIYDTNWWVTLSAPDLVGVQWDVYDYVCCRPYPNIGYRSVIVDVETGRLLGPHEIVDPDRMLELYDAWLVAITNQGLDVRDVPPEQIEFSSLALHNDGIVITTDRGLFGAAVGPTQVFLAFDDLAGVVYPDIVERARRGVVPEGCGC